MFSPSGGADGHLELFPISQTAIFPVILSKRQPIGVSSLTVVES